MNIFDKLFKPKSQNQNDVNSNETSNETIIAELRKSDQGLCFELINIEDVSLYELQSFLKCNADRLAKQLTENLEPIGNIHVVHPLEYKSYYTIICSHCNHFIQVPSGVIRVICPICSGILLIRDPELDEQKEYVEA